MAVTAGSRLGPYEVLAPLGAGGMGVVFRARDTRLNRDVAIKLLPDLFSSDPDRLARFEREAQTLAALNHPHIAHIHGVEESAGDGGLAVRALVMEFVDGEDLSARIARGPVPPDEALPIARQIAEALEAAHDLGIVHRDLKPANIKVTSDGTAKVLDFGLAKAMAPADAPGAALNNSPTFTSPALLRQAFGEAGTEVGVILGTAAYMAPEQAKGKPVDRRADIWAFGVVLYEMLTGRQLFAAETVAETIGLVVTREPDLGALPRATPPRVRELLRRCLERDPKQRLRDAGEARIVLSAPSAAVEEEGSPIRRTTAPRLAALVAGVAIVALLAGVAAGRFALAPADAPARPEFAFGITLPERQIDSGFLALSPDGSHLAFRVRGEDGMSEIWLRRHGDPAARPVPGTRDERGSKPFWSPDGRYLGFFVGNAVWRIPLDGSAPQRIAASPNPPRGGTWGAGDVVLFGTEGGPIYRIEAGGGAPPRAITTVDTADEDMHVWPTFLPDGKQFVFLADASNDEGHRIRLASVEHGDSKILLKGIRSSPTVDPRGALLVVVQRSQLVSYPFDFKRGTLGGESHLVADRVGAIGDRHETPTAMAAHGILAYQTGAAGGDLVRIALDGGGTTTIATAERFANPAVAPDGRHVAFDAVQPEGGRLVWTHDLDRGVRTLISDRAWNSDSAVWSPKGDTIYFAANAEGAWKLFRKAVTGTAPPELLGAPPEASDVGPLDASHDGKYLLATSMFRSGKRDFYLLPLDRPDAQWKHWAADATPDGARFSSDSRWIAYTSTASGRSEIYVSAVADPSHRVQISSSGGSAPVWSPKADRIFYRSPSDQLMSVSIDVSGGVVRPAAPQALLDLQSAGPFSQRNVFDLAPDGKSLLVVRRLSEEDRTIHVRTGLPLPASR